MFRGFLVVGVVLVTSACWSQESECHRRAQDLLKCCPFCDEDCAISKDAEAQLELKTCLNVSADPSQHDDDNDPLPPEDDPLDGEPTGGAPDE